MKLVDAIAAGDLLETARAYVALGLSVIPVRADGSKAPKLPAWTRYGNEMPTQSELVEWFGRGQAGGIGIPGGPASGNLSVLDFETAEAWETWRADATAAGEGAEQIDRCPLARTPRGGAHLYVRLDEPTRGVTLAEHLDERGAKRTLIETRAHGEQVIAPGSPNSCHPTGKPYTWERLGWLDGSEALAVPLETWVQWLFLAERQNKVERLAKRLPDNRDRRTVSGDDPGTDFNHRGTWEEAGLFDGGAEVVRDYGDDRGTVRRPDKKEGVSGTYGICTSSANGWPLFYCFSSNWQPFEQRGTYDRFGVFARVRHGGDLKAASKALRAAGYGKQDRPAPTLTWTPTTGPEGAERVGRGFKWSSELSAPERVDDWVWEGYLPRGAVTLLSALWKIGKTTLLAHLLRATAEGGEFLGKPLKACKVLYVSEEGERHWVRRRDALGFQDNIGFYLQPFPTRPAVDGWLAFVRQLTEDVKAHGFDLVVFDTLAKLWPVQEENDASAVDGALMPLWDVCKAGAGVLLIHHLRKSGGGEYTGSRGSGALSAFPDILVELTRFDAGDSKCKKRVLRAKGRYEETPDELVIELVDGNYIAVRGEEVAFSETPANDTNAIAELNTAGERDDLSNREASILDILREHGWCTTDTIRERLSAIGRGMRYQMVSDTLAGLLVKSQVKTVGKVRSKKTPQFWAVPEQPDLIPPLGVSGNEIREQDASDPDSSRSHDLVPTDTQGRNEMDGDTTAAE